MYTYFGELIIMLIILLSIPTAEASTAHVLYIDYGNHEQIPFSSVSLLPPQFSYLPAQALYCSLHPLSFSGVDAPVTASLHRWLSETLTGTRFSILIESVGTSNNLVAKPYIPVQILCSESSTALLHEVLGVPLDRCFPVDLPYSVNLSVFLPRVIEHCNTSSGVCSLVPVSEIAIQPPALSPLVSSSQMFTFSQSVSQSGESFISQGSSFQPTDEDEPIEDHKLSNENSASMQCDTKNEQKLSKLSTAFSSDSGECKSATSELHQDTVSDCTAMASSSPSNSLTIQSVAEYCTTNSIIEVQDKSDSDDKIICISEESFQAKANDSLPSDVTASAVEILLEPNALESTKGPSRKTILDLPVLELGLKVFDQPECLVSHVVSPSCLYIHPTVQAKCLLQLETSLKEFYSVASNRHPLEIEFMVQDTLCCIQSPEDHLWYRAMLCSPNLLSDDGHDLQVFFIDYGITQSVPSSIPIKLDPQFTAIAAQCVCCSLDGIRPVQASDKLIDLSDCSKPLNHCAIEAGGEEALKSPVNASQCQVPLVYSVEDWEDDSTQFLRSFTEDKQLVATITKCFGK